LQLVPANGKQERAALQENEDQKQTDNVIKRNGVRITGEKKNIKYKKIFLFHSGGNCNI
jgi:hypothetical protein